jgi:hypothetical protein
VPDHIQEVSSANRKCALSSALFRRVHGIEDPRKELGDCASRNLEMSERKGIIFALPFMGNVIPLTGPRGSNSWRPWLMLVNTIRMMQACQTEQRSDANCKGPK